MKKSIIATGAASLALAAMPVVGVFAADTSVTDTLKVTINKACTLRNNNTTVDGSTGAPTTNNEYSVTMSNGQLRSDIGTGASGVTGTSDNTIDVACNTNAGETGSNWTLTAAGKNDSTDLSAGGSLKIATGTNTEASGDSSWAFKVAGEAASGATLSPVEAYNNKFAAVPDSATIATGSGSATFTMTYQVYVNPTQATGSYTGGVVYTLANPQG